MAGAEPRVRGGHGGHLLKAFSAFASRLDGQYDIPEPTSLWLVGLALGGSAVRFRRRR